MRCFPLSDIVILRTADNMAMLKCLALALIIALAGCCPSGTWRYASLPGTPIAWDGLVTPPTARIRFTEHNNPPRRNARPKAEATAKAIADQPTDQISILKPRSRERPQIGRRMQS
jgi:hypothetical protein